MAQSGRLGMTGARKGERWQRWRNGESVTDISHAIGSFRTSITYVLRQQGGFTRLHTAASYTVPTCAHAGGARGDIAWTIAGHSLRQLAKALQRSPSTISREIVRKMSDMDFS
jgi:hypothetical protein